MEVTVPLVDIIIIILLTNEVATHLFNWWFREWFEVEVFLPTMLYILKCIIVVGLIVKLLT